MSYEAFKEQCINTWKDIEDNLPPMYQMGEDAHDAVIKYGVEFVEAIRKLPLPEVKQEPIEINWPDYHHQAMGCGLEDRGIRDKYDAMRHGWDCAVECCIEAVGDDPLYLAPPDAEALRKENEQLKRKLAELELDANRYKFLRENINNELYLTRNQQAGGYRSAKEEIELFPKEFEDVNKEELETMINTNTIWQLQIYPRNPVSFYTWNGASLDSVVDAALKGGAT